MAGFFDLLTHEDLCAKLEHDYRRIAHNPADVFAALDFTVTAWHLLEWKYSGDTERKAREELRNAHPILELCEHLAVVGKHFEATAIRHQSLSAMRRVSAWKRGSWAAVWAPRTWQDGLVVDLAGRPRDAFGESMIFSDFAVRVMAFWRGAGGCSGNVVPGSAS